MKIKDGFTVRKIANSYMAIPIGTRTKDVKGIVALSETGAFIWRLLENDISEDQLVRKLIEEYDVSKERASADVASFLEWLKEQEWIDETTI